MIEIIKERNAKWKKQNQINEEKTKIMKFG